jgi:putative peptide zinc metalloprotease protein
VVRAPHDGQWYAPVLDQANGKYLERGEPVGRLVDLTGPLIEAAITQEEAARVFAEVDDRVELRLPGKPEEVFYGTIVEKVPAGQTQLSSPALGTTGGGEIALDPERRGEAAEPYFKVLIRPDGDGRALRAGQKISVRFNLPKKTLAVRLYRSVLQLLQKRLGI